MTPTKAVSFTEMREFAWCCSAGDFEPASIAVHFASYALELTEPCHSLLSGPELCDGQLICGLPMGWLPEHYNAPLNNWRKRKQSRQLRRLYMGYVLPGSVEHRFVGAPPHFHPLITITSNRLLRRSGGVLNTSFLRWLSEYWWEETGVLEKLDG